MQKVFISRTLEQDSPAHLLTQRGFEVHGESLLILEYMPFELPKTFDWLFFYSQHGARAFFSQVDTDLIAHRKVGAFGPKTAAVVSEYVPCQFVGNGRGIDTAPAFDWVARGSKAVFARAEHSMRSVQRRLKWTQVIDLVTYHNSSNPKVRLPKHDVAVLTSPLNARSYISAQNAEIAEKIIAIGESTRSMLHELGVEEVIIPEKSSEESIVDLILSLESQ